MTRVVYLAGPFRDPDPAVMVARTRAAQRMAVAVAQCGCAPYVPHANLGYAYGLIDEAEAARFNDAILRRCDAVLLLPGWGESVGARHELDLAKRLGMPVFFSLEELQAWTVRS